MTEARQVHHRFLEIAPKISPELERAIARVGPVEIISPQYSPGVPFAERLCRAIAGQQLSVKAARAIWKRVIDSVPEGKTIMAHFAEIDPDVLRGCGLSRAKVKAVGAIAEAALLGQLEADDLKQLNTTERTQRLIALWGVGQWTVDMMNIFYFGELDVWPDGDVAARKTLEKLINKRRKTTRTAAYFSPYRSYLALYMWRYVDAKPDA